jgi:hypothetical protein
VQELRCENRILFGTMDGTVLEVRCRSARCGKEPGVIIIHRFSLHTGDLVGTKKYRDPAYRKEVS